MAMDMKTRRRAGVRAVTTLLAWLAIAGAAPAQEGVDARIAQADALRSADPERSAALLAGLERQAADLSRSQRLHLEYLRAYHMAIYGNRPDDAARLAMSLFHRADDVDLRFRAGALAARCHAITRDFGEGLRILNQVMPMRHSVRDEAVRHAGINTAAMLYSELGQYRLGLRYADEVLGDAPGPRARCMASATQLEARYHLQALPGDDGPLGRSIEQCLSIGEAMPANFLRITLARKLIGEGRPDDALELLRLHLPAIEAIDYQRLTVEAHALLAELLLGRGDLDGAQGHADLAIARARSFSTGLPLVTAYRVRYEIAERGGDAGAALAHYRRYVEADMAHLGDVRARELAYDIVRDETTRRARRIEMLDQQNQILRLQEEAGRQAARQTRLLVAALLALIAAIGSWTWYAARRAERARDR